MKWMKRILSVVAIGLLLLSSASSLVNVFAQAEGLAFTAGTYRGEAEGFGGTVEAEVTVSEGAIDDIVVMGDGETPDIGGAAMAQIAEAVVNSQSLAVDTVSGATVSSEAILSAIEQALVEAGGDVDYLKDPANASQVEVAEQADIDADVVIVGAGGAGLAAAVEAAEAGKHVIVLEQLTVVGGNTNRATGGMNASETSVQEELGIEDSNETFYNDTFEGGHELNDPELLTTMVEHSAEALEWINSLGANLNDVSFSGGATNARIHKPEDGSAVGPIIVNALSERLEELGVEVLLEAKVTAINQDDAGVITGVTAQKKDANEFVVNAPAVVLATGGFGANPEMIKEYDATKAQFETSNHPGADGSGIAMAQAVGADVYQMEYIQTHPTTQPGTGKLYTEGVRGDGAILVNKEGLRFIDELETRDVVSEAILEQTDSQAYLVVSQDIVDGNKSLQGYIDQGDATTGETVEALAEALEIDPQTLKETVENYTSYVQNEEDTEFGRENMSSDLATGPYYAIPVTPAIHHTMGGLKINPETEVLDTNGEVIPGLYAAGEVAGGIHGGNRIGGNAVLDIIVFGRIAGQNAAAFAGGDTSESAVDEASEVSEEAESTEAAEEAESNADSAEESTGVSREVSEEISEETSEEVSEEAA